MANDASAALGAPEIAGTFVNPKGFTKKMTASVAGGQVAGAVGSLAANAIAGGASRSASELPSFGRVGYVAVSENEVALVKTKTGALKMKISDEILARVPRSEVASAELDEGKLLSHLSITFSNGAVWQFDIPRQGKATAKSVVHALGGAIV
jgi:hypothetical protein